ncbi:hypothetical protein [Phycicoccus avicenniae]|uniref:hypothetical protein n=1 Tax=Phycicoccus avicenniae TaxID=2828860 RepID=UPI003D2D6165
MGAAGWSRVAVGMPAALLLAVAAGCASQEGADRVREWAGTQPGIATVRECEARLVDDPPQNALTCRLVAVPGTDPADVARLLGGFADLADGTDLGDRPDITLAVGPDLLPLGAGGDRAALAARAWSLLRSGPTAVEGVEAVRVPADLGPSTSAEADAACIRVVAPLERLRAVLAASRKALATDDEARAGCVEAATSLERDAPDLLALPVAGGTGSLDTLDRALSGTEPTHLVLRGGAGRVTGVEVAVARTEAVLPTARALRAAFADARGSVSSPLLTLSLGALADTATPDDVVSATAVATAAPTGVARVSADGSLVRVELAPGAASEPAVALLARVAALAPTTQWQLRRDGAVLNSTPADLLVLAPALDALRDVRGVEVTGGYRRTLRVDLEDWDDATADRLVRALRGAADTGPLVLEVEGPGARLALTSTTTGPALRSSVTGDHDLPWHLLREWGRSATS